MTALILIHVAISLVAILSGLVMMFGLLTSKRLDSWTMVFLITTIATSVTGFLFPFRTLPGTGVGVISIVLLAIAIFARYARHLRGAWRWIFVVTAMASLYFNVFVLIAQLFLKLPALKALAPTQSDPPFLAAQFLNLLLFLVLTVLAMIRFRVPVTKA
jgi:hypothetical protein